MTFNNLNNGFGFSYIMKNSLDVILNDKNGTGENSSFLRLSLNTSDDIKKYWLNDSLESINYTLLEKEKIDKIDDFNYNIRYSLNNELSSENILEKNINLIKSSDYEKLFRLKNRYSIKNDDNLFLIELTSVKTSSGKTFKASNTLKSPSKYEVEIEFIGKDEKNLDSTIIFKKMLNYIQIILSIIQNNKFLLSNRVINNVIDNYASLTGIKYKTQFIAASPKTIHRYNLLKNPNIKNIFGGYAVTLKADGERNLLYVNKSNDDPNLNGKIFIFNNNFEVIDTGFKDITHSGTLIEGEFVSYQETSELFMYDILFYNGQDVRQRHLVNLQKDFKTPSRLDLIDKFLKSTSRKIVEGFDEADTITIKKKAYQYSTRNDGTDIFQKINNIWDTRKFQSFNTDGIIFVPIREYYPIKGGTWDSLFKWKPPNLNTIDFLIKVNKDDNGKDVKSPQIEITKRPDGKDETLLKQYKTIKLYVSGSKVFFNGATKQKQTKIIPVLFNPFGKVLENNNNLLGSGESLAEEYNVAKIFIDENEKMYANDPLTNEKVEIMDDIIVEFGYNHENPDGFKWVPYRFRKDKTNLYKNGKPNFGNNEFVANDIFKSINNPVTEDMITTGVVPISQDIGVEVAGMNSGSGTTYYAELSKNNNVTISNEKRERYSYQNFHNQYIKFQLLYLSSPFYINKFTTGQHGKILDLCCGKGVDINKIIKAHFAEVVGMDIDLSNVRYAENWYKKMVPFPKPKAYYVRGDSSKLIWPNQDTGFTDADKQKTRTYIPTKYYFDTISVQFCFHYFFENEITLRSIIQNFNDNLKIGGYVLGTCFDGERIYKSLESLQSISGKTESGELMWKIDKKYTKTKLAFTDKKPNLGKKIDVFVKTIGVMHSEYLVNFNYLDCIMNEYGFEKVMVKPFEDFYNELIKGENILDMPEKDFQRNVQAAKDMSEDQKRFSFLSTGFIYKKEKNSADALFKKLVLLMEKKDKVSSKPEAVVVSEETEALIENMEES